MTVFRARDHLAGVLGCEPGDLELSRGPFETYRGLEAEYARADEFAGTVLIGHPAAFVTSHGAVRTVTTQTRSTVRRSRIAVDTEVAW
jgi:hypothetical protein